MTEFTMRPLPKSRVECGHCGSAFFSQRIAQHVAESGAVRRSVVAIQCDACGAEIKLAKPLLAIPDPPPDRFSDATLIFSYAIAIAALSAALLLIGGL